MGVLTTLSSQVAGRRGAHSAQSLDRGHAHIESIQKIKHFIRGPGTVTSTDGDLTEDTSIG